MRFHWLRRALASICAILALTGTFAQAKAKGTAASVQGEVRSLLDSQVAAWNRGDLEGFMAGYWKSDDLVFQSGGKATRGWQPTLERYRARYKSAGKEMGQLKFEGLEIVTLGPDAALARGGWHLRMKDGSEPKGLFTLVLRKFPEGWRIVHDHSCADEK